MKALDTNLLVRLIVNDEPKQAQLVRTLLETAETHGQQCLIPLVVMLELIWVLESKYELGQADIITAVEALTSLSVLRFEHEDVLQEFVTEGRRSKTELSDLLIGLTAKHLGASQVLTFDRKAAKNPLFKAVGTA